MNTITNGDKKLSNWLSNLLTSGMEDDGSLHLRRVKRTNLAVILFMMAGPGFASLFFYLGAAATAFSTLAGSALALLGIPLLRLTKSLSLSANYLFVCFASTVFANALYHGGFDSPGSIWFLMAPIGGTILLSFRGAVYWSAFVLLCLALLACLDGAGLTPAPLLSGSDMVLYERISLCVVLGLLLVFAYLYKQESSHELLLSDSRREKAELETQRAQAALAELERSTELNAKLARDLEVLPMPVYEVDNDWNLVFVNQAGAKLIGLPREACLGKRCRDLLDTEVCGTMNCPLERVRRQGVAVSIETRALRRSRRLPIAYTGIPQLDSQGKVKGALNAVYDLSPIYELAQELGQLALQMRSASSRAADEMGAIYAASEDIAERSSSTSSSAREIATDMTTVSRSAIDMRGALDSVAERCQRASQLSHAAAALTAAARETMAKLEASSKAIDAVAEVIADFADQTNLLAMNATIQAAKAGEAGQGFAVVAGEVKALAGQTKRATEEIYGQIEEIQTRTKDAAVAIQAISRTVADLALNTDDIAQGMDRQTAIFSGAVTSTERSFRGSKQVAESTSALTQASKDISERLRGFSSAAQQLVKTAVDLDAMAKRFKL